MIPRPATEEERSNLVKLMRAMQLAEAKYKLAFVELQAVCEVPPSYTKLDDHTGAWSDPRKPAAAPSEPVPPFPIPEPPQ